MSELTEDQIIDDVMAMTDEEVRAALIAEGVDPDAEVALLRALATELRVKHSSSN